MTPRKREICWNFGIPPREPPLTIVDNIEVTLDPGAIILLNGPSGSGKSSILNVLAERTADAVWVGRGRFSNDRPIVDGIAPRRQLSTVLEILTACGLGEPRLWVRRFGDLSEGEQFRTCLGRAVGRALGSHSASRPVILCDEFAAILHRRAAKAVAYNLRKLITRHGLTMVLATTHEDLIEDLQPDQTIRLHDHEAVLVRRSPRRSAMSLRRRVTVERGSVRDYRHFSSMHYRHRDGLGFVDRVFLLKETRTGTPLGILVFAHASMELSLRNRSTGGRFVRNVRRLNRELRILRRLVMHPDVRGCGLGHWFVRKTLPRVGVRFVECLAAMGQVNPVFEKAGMHRVGRCPLPKGRLKLLDRMKAMDVDPFADDFPKMIARYPHVRRLVEKTIESWARSQHGAMECKVRDKPPTQLSESFRQLIGSPPVYYLWDRDDVFPILEREEKHDPVASRAGRSLPKTRLDDPQTNRASRGRGRHHPDAGRSDFGVGGKQSGSTSKRRPQRRR